MLCQKEWEQINEIILLINNIKNTTTMRKTFLQMLMDLINFDFSDFNIGKLNNALSPILVDPVVVSKFDKKFEEDFIFQYESTYAPMDYVNWLFLTSDSLVYRESDLVNDAARKKSPFYMDYLKPFGLEYIAGIIVSNENKLEGAITLYKSEKNGDFTEKDLYIMQQLVPHLKTKFKLEEENIQRNSKSVSMFLKEKYALTNREIEIIGLVYSGLSNSQISSHLSIAETTVKKHLYNIYDKLSVNNRVQLVKFLFNNHLTTIW